MKQVMAIDPGSEQSAVVILNEKHPIRLHEILPNAELLSRMANQSDRFPLALEMVACYGMPVGEEVFSTVLWIGRFLQVWGEEHTHFVYRKDVKMHLCQQTKGVNDAVIRQAVIDRFGPGKEKAIGTKKSPGPLYGLRKDEWSALAIALTWADRNLKCFG